MGSVSVQGVTLYTIQNDISFGWIRDLSAALPSPPGSLPGLNTLPLSHDMALNRWYEESAGQSTGPQVKDVLSLHFAQGFL